MNDRIAQFIQEFGDYWRSLPTEEAQKLGEQILAAKTLEDVKTALKRFAPRPRYIWWNTYLPTHVSIPSNYTSNLPKENQP